MASPYFPDDCGEEDQPPIYVPTNRETVDQIVKRSRQFGIDRPSQFISYGVSVFFWITTELLNGSRLLIQREDGVAELVFPHPTRPGEPLVAPRDTSDTAPPAWWPAILGEPPEADE